MHLRRPKIVFLTHFCAILLFLGRLNEGIATRLAQGTLKPSGAFSELRLAETPRGVSFPRTTLPYYLKPYWDFN
jgi:hypothetical protein